MYVCVMPISKNARRRFGVIDAALRSGAVDYDRAPSKDQLLNQIHEEGIAITKSQLEKDLKRIKEDYDVDWTYETRMRVRYYRYRDADMTINSSDLTPVQLDRIEGALDLIAARANAPGMEFVNEVIPLLRENLNLMGGRKGAESIILSDHEFYSGRKHIERLSKAIRQREVLDIDYRPFHKEGGVQRTHPHVLKQFNGRWFLVGYVPGYEPNKEWGEDHTYKWRRVMSLDRIHGIETVSRKDLQKEHEADRQYREDFQWNKNWGEYFGDVMGPTVPRKADLEKVVIRFKKARAPYVHTKPLHESQIPAVPKPMPEAVEGKIEFSFELKPNREFYNAILAFGPDAEVVSPAAVRREVAERVQQLNATYFDESGILIAL